MYLEFAHFPPPPLLHPGLDHFHLPEWLKSLPLDPSASFLPPCGLHLVQDPVAPIPLVEAKVQTLGSRSLKVWPHPLPPTIFPLTTLLQPQGHPPDYSAPARRMSSVSLNILGSRSFMVWPHPVPPIIFRPQGHPVSPSMLGVQWTWLSLSIPPGSAPPGDSHVSILLPCFKSLLRIHPLNNTWQLCSYFYACHP